MNITIKDQIVRRGRQQMPVDKFCRVVADNCVSGLREEPIPDNVKWIVEDGKNAVYIIELKPELRQVLWVGGGYEDEDGDWVSGDREVRTIATPYVIVQVRFCGGELGIVQVYFRNEPLKSLDDPLFEARLKNITTIGVSHGYLCLDGLRIKGLKRKEDILNEVVNHLWAGEFNDEFQCNNFREFHADERVSTIERWEAESKKDPEFVLGVKWTPVGHTVRQVIRHQLGSVPPNLGNLLLLNGK